jgi:lipoyl-dependent peroxiredoxin
VVSLSLPGSPRVGAKSEQPFAAGWSACFEGALGVVAHRKKLKLPADTAIDAEVDLHLDNGVYFLSARLNISIPGVERDKAQAILSKYWPSGKKPVGSTRYARRGRIDWCVDM